MDNLQYRPNLQSLKTQEESEDDAAEVDEDADSDDEHPKAGGIFKAPKLTPVYFEDRETKQKRREDIHHKKKMGRS